MLRIFLKKHTHLKFFICSLLLIVLVCTTVPTNAAAKNTDFTSLLKSIKDPDPIISLTTLDNMTVTYTYDNKNNRTNKNYANNSIEFSYKNNNLVYENGINGEINYLYENFGNGDTCIGFIHNNNTYYYLPDESGNVKYIVDSNYNKISKYEYLSTVPKVYEYSNNGWIECKDNTFIGYINPIRYQYWYYDTETNFYHTGGGIYYNTNQNEFIQNEYTYVDKNGNKISDISLLAASDLQSMVAGLYTSLINSSIWGVAIPQVSEAAWNSGSRWYSGLYTYDITARCLFAENTWATRNNDRAGVAYVIANRVNTNNLGDSDVYSVVTHSSQFSSVNPGNYKVISSTNNSISAKSKTDTAWQNATLLACILYYTCNTSDMNTIVAKPAGITNQVQFYGLNNVYTSSSFYITSGVFYQNGTRLKDIAVAGVGFLTITSSSTKQLVLEPYYQQGYNLFYNHN